MFKKFICSILVCAIVFSCIGGLSVSATNEKLRFSDVAKSFWGYGEINKAASNGVMNGTSANTFDPYGNVTTIQLLTIIKNITFGADARLREDWRSNTLYFLYNKDEINVEEHVYPLNTYHAYDYYINGKNYTIDNTGNTITREECAFILSSFMRDKQSPAIKITDANEIASEYEPYLSNVLAHGIMTLDASSKFYPKSYLTRAEQAVIANRMYSYLKGDTNSKVDAIKNIPVVIPPATPVTPPVAPVTPNPNSNIQFQDEQARICENFINKNNFAVKLKMVRDSSIKHTLEYSFEEVPKSGILIIYYRDSPYVKTTTDPTSFMICSSDGFFYLTFTSNGIHCSRF